MKKFFMLFIVMLQFSQLNAQISWDAPVNLSGALLDASDPQVVVDSNGNITAAWLEGSFVLVNIRPFGGNWGLPTTLSLTGSSSPRLAVDGNGKVTAVWVEATGIVTTSSHPLNGSWSLATALSGLGASEPSLNVNSTGDIAVIWTRGGFIEAQTKTAAGNFNLNSSVISAANSNHPHIAIGPNGKILAVWHSVSSGTDLVFSSTAQIGGNWTAAKSITAAGLTALSQDYPKAAVDGAGNGYALWFRYAFDGENYLNVCVSTAALSATSGNWTPIPVLLSEGGTVNPAMLTHEIAVDSDGNIMALWTTSQDSNSFAVESSSQSKAGSWLPTAQVVNGNLYAHAADTAFNSIGSLIEVNMFDDGSTISIEARESQLVGPFQNVWASPATISSGSNQGYPKVAVSYVSSGNLSKFATVWLAEVSGLIRVQSSTGTLNNLNPPTNVQVSQSSIDFGVYTDYVNTLTWSASSSPNLFGYAVYRNGVHYADIDANATLQIIEHNQIPADGSVSYSVVTIDFFGTQSQKVTVNI